MLSVLIAIFCVVVIAILVFGWSLVDNGNEQNKMRNEINQLRELCNLLVDRYKSIPVELDVSCSDMFVHVDHGEVSIRCQHDNRIITVWSWNFDEDDENDRDYLITTAYEICDKLNDDYDVDTSISTNTVEE